MDPKEARPKPDFTDRFPVGPAVITGAILLALLSWFALFQHLARLESEAIAGAAVANVNLAQAFDEHVLRIVREVDLQSQVLAADLNRSGHRNVDLGAFHRRIASALPFVARIAWIDDSGHVAASSEPVPRLYMGDREHFRALRGSDTGALFIGTPVTSRSTNDWWIPMTRRLSTPGGNFAGVLLFAVDPAYFDRFYGTVSLGKQGVVTLVRNDGIIIARHPDPTDSLGKDASALPDMKAILTQQAGFRVTAGAMDATRRVIAFNSVAGYPVKVIVGTSLSEALAPVHDKKPAYYGFTILATLYLLGAGFLIAWQHDRQRKAISDLAASRDESRGLAQRAEKALADLKASEERFRSLTTLGADYYWEQDAQLRFTAVSQARLNPEAPHLQYVIGRTRWEIPGSELTPEEWAQHRAMLEARQTFRDFEYWILTPEGQRVCISVSGEPVFDAGAAFLGYRGVSRFITKSKELLLSAQQLGALSGQVFKIQEEERLRISRDLHDQVGQAVTALTLHLQALEREVKEAEPAQHVRVALAIADQTAKQVHNISLNLRPPHLDELGLVAALGWHVDQQAQATGLLIHFDAEPLNERLHPSAELACFRVQQEALTNVVRHGDATEVWVTLRKTGNELELTVLDDGVGFDASATRDQPVTTRLGLIGMSERAKQVGGRLEISSTPGGGTEVRAVFPALPRDQPAPPD